MKNIWILMLVGFCSIQLNAQTIMDSNPVLTQSNMETYTINNRSLMYTSGEQNVELMTTPFDRKVKTGKTLTIIGGTVLATGIVMVATADEHSYVCQSGRGCEGNAAGAFGAVLVIPVGVGLTIPGVIVWNKAAKKRKQYLLENT